MSASDGGHDVEIGTTSPGQDVERRRGEDVPALSGDEDGVEGATRRLAALSGVITILILDLLALEDITTAGEWAVEFPFLVASVPALLFLGRMALKKPRDGKELGKGDDRRESTGGEP